jgi:RNA polymerase sigma-70 factor (ECF subfamily)
VSELRLVRSPAPGRSPDASCLEAFQSEIDYVYRSLRRLGTRPADVDDLAQDVFLALRRCWVEYDPTRPLRPYLFGIAFRVASARRRKQTREVGLQKVAMPDPPRRPDELLASKQARNLVLAALERIPLRRRSVIVMHDIDQIGVKAIASTLGIPLYTIYSRLSKGRRELASALRQLMRRGT